MTEMVKNIEFFDFYLTLIRVLKIVEIFKAKEKFHLTGKKIVMFDFYMRFPFMTEEERKRQNFDEKYAFYFMKPNYSLYDAVLSILVSKKMISYSTNTYHIEQYGEKALKNMECEYMSSLSKAGEYILHNVIKMSDKKINEDIIDRSKNVWEGQY
ncbi:ABC-three component system middle component 2 [Anaerotignum sp.]|uniref:ABC-three component system middle component 2 n=1 Tax=Anaerotignum sp. TaxID=2039241 RepID=UPI002714E06D|nr:ABC-three component system middle component 2 [Anaerotignum sp.]